MPPEVTWHHYSGMLSSQCRGASPWALPARSKPGGVLNQRQPSRAGRESVSNIVFEARVSNSFERVRDLGQIEVQTVVHQGGIVAVSIAKSWPLISDDT